MVDYTQPIARISPGLSPTAHMSSAPSEVGGSKGGSRPADMEGSDKGAGVAGSHRPGDSTGLDKSAGSGVLPTFAPNAVNADMTAKIAAGLMMSNTAGMAMAQQQHRLPGPERAEEALHRFWVGQREPEEPRDLPYVPGYQMDIHEINKVQESDMETDSRGGQNMYLPFQEEEEEYEEDKLEEEETRENIVVDEALTWTGHVSEYHYSPEKLYTSSLQFVSTMLPWRVPISRH